MTEYNHGPKTNKKKETSSKSLHIRAGCQTTAGYDSNAAGNPDRRAQADRGVD